MTISEKHILQDLRNELLKYEKHKVDVLKNVFLKDFQFLSISIKKNLYKNMFVNYFQQIN